MEQLKKNKRSANFTNNDRSLLINIVAKYKDVIENKLTDAVTVREKLETWRRICEEFNSCGSSTPRDVETLKRCYENRKKLLRKSAAFQRRQLYKTGGGLPDETLKQPDDELLLSFISHKSVSGMEDRFGGDALVHNTAGVSRSCPEPMAFDHTYSLDHDDEDIDFLAQSSEWEPNTPKKGCESEDKVNEPFQDHRRIVENTWKHYKIGDLKLPLSKELDTSTSETKEVQVQGRRNTQTSSISSAYGTKEEEVQKETNIWSSCTPLTSGAKRVPVQRGKYILTGSTPSAYGTNEVEVQEETNIWSSSTPSTSGAKRVRVQSGKYISTGSTPSAYGTNEVEIQSETNISTPSTSGIKKVEVPTEDKGLTVSAPSTSATKKVKVNRETFPRRRPRTIIKALATSDIGEKYNRLLNDRLEIANYQKQHLQNSIRIQNVEHELRVELLKAKIRKANRS